MVLSALALAWLAGTYLALLSRPPIDLLLPLAGLGLATVPAAVAVWPAPQLRLPALALASLLLAAARTLAAEAALAGDPLDGLQGEIELAGIVASAPDIQGQRTTLVLEVQARLAEGGWQPQPGRVWLQLSAGPRLTYGDAVLVRGRLTEPRSGSGGPLPTTLRRQSIRYVLERPRLELVERGAGDPLWSALHRSRQAIAEVLRRYLPEPHASLLAGILVGARTDMPPELRQALVTTGTSHIVAVSGFNVVVLAGLVVSLLSRAVGRRYVLAPALACLAFYTALTGPQPSAVRAALMASAALVATAVGRAADPLTSVVSVAAAMLAVEPLLGLDLGFQLSVIATLGLILLQPLLAARLAALPRWLSDTLAATLAAQLATLPLLAATFQSLSLISPLANLLIAPVLPAVMGLGVVLALAAPIPPLASAVAWPAWAALSYVLAVIRGAGAWPGALVPVGGLPLAALAGASLLVLTLGLLGLAEARALLARLPRRGAWTAPRLAVAGALAATLLPVASSAVGEPRLQLWTLDLGGSLAALARTPGGRTAVLTLDAPSARLAAALARHLRPWETRLDVIAVGGEAELPGLARLFDRFPAEVVLVPAAGQDLAAARPPLARLGRGAWLELDHEVWLNPLVDARDQFLGWQLRHGLVAVALALSERSADPTLAPEPRALVLARTRPDPDRPASDHAARAPLVVAPGLPRLPLSDRAGPSLALAADAHGDIELRSDGLELVVRPSRCAPPLLPAECTLLLGPTESPE